MKKNVAGQAIGAQMITAVDGSAFTGTVTVYVTGDAGTQAIGSVGSGVCTHEGNGFHTYAPAQAETNYDHIGFTFTGTGAIPVTIQLYTAFPQTGDNYARLGAPAGASIAADIADKTGYRLSATGVDDIWDEPIAGHIATGTTGLSEALGSAALADVTLIGAPSSTSFDFTGGSTSNNFYNDKLVYILSGTGIGQVRPILSSSYSGGTTTLVMDEAFIVSPVNGDRAVIIVSHVHPKSQITSDIDANSTQLSAIKAKTDSLTFTVAGQVDANIQAVNDVALVGNGSGTPFNV